MKTISVTQLEELSRQAVQSPRGRAHLNVHDGAEDLVRRFFVAVEPRSYVRPHRHHAHAELITVLRGCFELLTFDDDGRLLARPAMGESAGVLAIETPAGVWHSLLSGASGSILLEVKQGPYDPATAAEFASWAPAEGTPGALELLERMRNAEVGQTIPK